MTAEEMKARIESAFEGAVVHVRTDGHHFEAVVVSEAFDGLSRIKQHKLVYGVLREELREEVHALQLRTFTPAEWESVREFI
jgi:acid stress-induced BolA-like protein IbaG/YrbA